MILLLARAVVVSVFAVVLLAQGAGAGLDGLYRCHGTNPDGQPYDGYVQIVAHDTRYEVRWTFTDPTQNASGIGILVDGHLAVAYANSGLGIVVYAIADGVLTGTWADPTTEGTHQEVLTKLPRDHPPVISTTPPTRG